MKIKVKSFEECKDIIPEKFHEDWIHLFGNTFTLTHKGNPPDLDHWFALDVETGKRYSLNKKACDIVEGET